MKLRIEKPADPVLGRYTEETWQAALRDGAMVRIDIRIEADDVREAVTWGRAQKFSHERDGELAALLADWALALGQHSVDFDDVDLLSP